MSLSSPVPQYLAAAVTTAGVICGAYYAYRIQQNKKNKLPDKWKEVGYLKNLYLYPIKSVGPVILNQGECTELGMRDGRWIRDRHLMIVDAANNNFVTARTYPEMLTIKPSIKKAILTLRHPDMEPIDVNLAEVMVTEKPIQATVWGSPVQVYDCGEEVNKWITKFLNREGLSFRLVYYASQKCRPAVVPESKKILFKKCRETDIGAFPDQLSYNLISETSVNDLNTRLQGTKVSVRNFRPNFHVVGIDEPYVEEKWNYVKIGENVFQVVKTCTRCIMTNVDPETGVPYQSKEPMSQPLDTLRSYRLLEDPEERKAAGNAPRMGIHMALRSGPGGIISVNDRVYAA